ncbi:MAG TPA: DUF222 domain-containing protein, partial [Oryzihumus sp.]
MTAALAGVEGVLHQGVGAELGPFFAELDALRRGCEAGQVATLAEALERGEVSSATCASAAGWVLEWAPSYRCGGAADLVKVAQACLGRPVGAGAVQVLDHGSVQRLRSCVLSGRVGVRGAAVALAELAKLGPRLTREAVGTVWAGFLAVAEESGPKEIRGLRERIIATYGRQDEFQVRQDRLRHGVSLSPGRGDDGMVEYLLRLDPEGASVLEAAIGPLSAPNPVDGVADLRSSDQRRGDALVQVLRRSAAAGGDAPAQTKAQLFVTMNYEDLRDACGSGTVLGTGTTPGDGTLLAPETVRRIACDATLIPVVLGTQGRGAGPRAQPAPVHPGPAAVPVAAGRRLHHPRVQRAAVVVRRAPRHPLGQRRGHRRGQRGAGVRAAPHDRPPARLDRDRHRHRGHLAHLSPPPRTRPATAGHVACPGSASASRRSGR